GKLDLAVTNAGSTVSVLLGNGDGSFQSKQDFDAGNGPEGLAAGDFNGDTRPDLAVADQGGNTVTVLLANPPVISGPRGTASFQAKQDFATGASPLAVATADVNGDGKPDLLVANGAGNSVSVLMGNGNGHFTAK